MQKIAMSALAVLGAAALFLAALPQDAAQVRKPLKYGDRCARRVGERFYLNMKDSTAFLGKDGDFVLLAIGVDYAEFADNKTRVLVPLSTLRMRVPK